MFEDAVYVVFVVFQVLVVLLTRPGAVCKWGRSTAVTAKSAGC